MWALVCAEWLKTRKRPANWVLASIVLALVIITFAAVTAAALADGAPARELLRFPHGFRLPLEILSALGAVIGIVFMANSVGSEYGGDTWKVLLPRRGSRMDFLLGKLLSGLFFLAVLIGTALVLGQALGLVGAALLGDGLLSADRFSAPELFGSLTLVVLQIAVFAALTLLVTVLCRSAVLGIVCGVVCTLTFGVAAASSSFAAWVLPSVHLVNLQAHWLPEEDPAKAEMLAQVTKAFGTDISAAGSALVVVGWVLGCVAVALWVFRRRDVAGQ
jgi:ABC-type transport system involved in multi-copper enzyme maturation permease subunit